MRMHCKFRFGSKSTKLTVSIRFPLSGGKRDRNAIDRTADVESACRAAIPSAQVELQTLRYELAERE